MKKLWIVIAVILLLCGCAHRQGEQAAEPKEENVPANTVLQGETEPHGETQNEKQTNQESIPETDTQNSPAAAQPDAETAETQKETPAPLPEEENTQEDTQENTAPESSAKPCLADFGDGQTPDAAFICSPYGMSEDGTRYMLYDQPSQSGQTEQPGMEGRIAPIELTAGIDLYERLDAQTESDTPYRNGALKETAGNYRTMIITSDEYDLDGCGENETIQLLYIMGEGNCQIGLRVIKNGVAFDAEEDLSLYDTAEHLWLADLDADGNAEIYLSACRGTVLKNIFAWELTETALKKLQGGWENGSQIVAMNFKDNALYLTAYTNVAGAHYALCRYVLRDGQFIAIDAAWSYVYQNDASIFGDMAVLTVKDALPVTLEDGTAAELSPGTILIFTAGDQKSFVCFLTKEGTRGRVALTVKEGGAAFVNGKMIDNYFVFLPHAN